MRHPLIVPMVPAILGCFALSPAGAAPPPGDPPHGKMLIAWTTWVHDAPNDASRTTDELGTGTPVLVLGCEGDWCLIREDQADGYVLKRYLTASIEKLQPTADKAACIPAQFYTAEGPLGLTICPAKPEHP